MIIGLVLFYGGLGSHRSSLASLDELKAKGILKFVTDGGKVNLIFLLQYAVITVT